MGHRHVGARADSRRAAARHLNPRSCRRCRSGLQTTSCGSRRARMVNSSPPCPTRRPRAPRPVEYECWTPSPERAVLDLNVGSLASDVDWSPDGDVLAISGKDGDGAFVRLVDRSGSTIEELPFGDVLVTVAGFALDGDALIVSMEPPRGRYLPDVGRVEVWDWRNATLTQTIDADPYHAVPSPVDDLVAIGPSDVSPDQSMSVWNIRTGERVTTLGGHTGSPNHLAFTADGTRLAVANGDGTTRIWDPHDRRATTHAGRPPRPRQLRVLQPRRHTIGDRLGRWPRPRLGPRHRLARRDRRTACHAHPHRRRVSSVPRPIPLRNLTDKGLGPTNDSCMVAPWSAAPWARHQAEKAQARPRGIEWRDDGRPVPAGRSASPASRTTVSAPNARNSIVE